MLHSVGPESMYEDEHEIGHGYQQKGLPFIFGAALTLVACFFDIKWVVVLGLLILVILLYAIEARLYDLCIRLRRTNILISSQSIDKASE